MKRFCLIALAIFIVVFTFWTLLLSYFQQDEWHTFGMIQSYGLEYVTSGKPIWTSLLSDRIGARFLMYVLFGVFSTNPIPYGLFSLLIHFLNAFLLFRFVSKVTSNQTIGVISAAFFLMNSASDQAYSWFGTMAGSAISITFILLSLIFYYSFLTKRRYSYNLLSIMFLWTSFLFKEVGYFIFVSYPILWLIYTKNKSLKSFVKNNLLLFIYGAVMTVFFIQSVLFIPGVRANYIMPQASGFIKVINHLVLYPLEGISQIFLPPPFIFNLSRYFASLVDKSLQPDTPPFDLFYTTIMAEYVSIGISIAIILFLIVVYKNFIRKTKEKIRLFFLSSVFFFLFSFLPYIVIDKFDAYLDSRYYYSTLIGASIILGVLIYSLLQFVKSNKGRKLAIFLFAVLFFYHSITLMNSLYRQFIISRERISMIDQIKNIAPVLSKKTVFFIRGNSPGYYGIPELKVPFQSGLGQVLMTIYSSENPSYTMFFKEETFWKTADGGFLYDTLAQGYKEANGVGFGYYYDQKTLKEGLSKKLFNKESVISLFYNSDEKTVKKQELDEINL